MCPELADDLDADTVIGSYRLIKEIGRGGMGTVYEAQHVLLPRRAAIKVMHSQLKRQPGMATRLLQEASILEDIRHPGIVRVFECNVLPDHRPWIAMELVEGETLAERLSRRKTLAPGEVALLLAETGDVLTAVHAHGVVHRDLKPANLIHSHDPALPLRVIDWGVARLGPEGRITLDGMTPGTPIYMSPEQSAGRDIAPPCDIYSLGVIAYEALAGSPPFDGRTLAEVVCMHLTSTPIPLSARCGAPVELCELVHRMLDKDPAVRPDAAEVHLLARSIANELSTWYDSFELAPASEPLPYRHVGMIEPSDEVVVVDPEVLELGVTEQMRVIRRPRWTPEIGFAFATPRQLHARAISPRARNDQVSGEFHARRR